MSCEGYNFCNNLYERNKTENNSICPHLFSPIDIIIIVPYNFKAVSYNCLQKISFLLLI